MKRTLMLLVSASLMHSCQPDGPKNNQTVQEPIKSGVEILADSLPILEDKLNNLHFSIHVYTNDRTANGSYDVQTEWGYNIATTTIKMPDGGEDLKPILRRGSKPYSFIIGFRYDDDTAFNDFYEVQGGKHEIKTQYLKYYSFE